MKAANACALAFGLGLLAAPLEADAQPAASTDISRTIIAIERAAMERWAMGDPSGYLEIMAPDVTVFDPLSDRRIDGIAAVTAHYEPIRGKVAIPRFEFFEPRVQQIGDAAVLTFSFVSYDASDAVVSRWNFTEVYRRMGDAWRIVQSHASYTSGRPPERR